LLTDGKSRNDDFRWTRAGGKYAFASTRRNGKDFDIYVAKGIDPASAKMVKQVDGEWAPYDWSPDDKRILIRHFVSIDESYLYVIDAETGESTEVNPRPAGQKTAYGAAAFSADGKSVLYTSDEGSEVLRLWRYDLVTTKKVALTPEIKWDVDGFR